jgi:hypothetical protein
MSFETIPPDSGVPPPMLSEEERPMSGYGCWMPRLCTRVIIHLLDYPEDLDHEDQDKLLLLVTGALWFVRHLQDGPRCTIIHGALFFLERLKPHISNLVANENPLIVGHRLLVATLMISQKLYLNEQYSVKYYAETVAQHMITAPQLEQLEKTLLDCYLNLEELNEDNLFEQYKVWAMHTAPLFKIIRKAGREGKLYPLFRTGIRSCPLDLSPDTYQHFYA